MDIKVEGVEGQLGVNGILLRIFEPGGGTAKGRLWVGKAKLRWYKGKASKNYKEVSITDFSTGSIRSSAGWLDTLRGFASGRDRDSRHLCRTRRHWRTLCSSCAVA